MLKVFLNSAPNSVDKSFELTQALAKEALEFLPGDGNVGLIFYFLLMLLLAKQGNILKQSGGK